MKKWCQLNWPTFLETRNADSAGPQQVAEWTGCALQDFFVFGTSQFDLDSSSTNPQKWVQQCQHWIASNLWWFQNVHCWRNIPNHHKACGSQMACVLAIFMQITWGRPCFSFRTVGFVFLRANILLLEFSLMDGAVTLMRNAVNRLNLTKWMCSVQTWLDSRQFAHVLACRLER